MFEPQARLCRKDEEVVAKVMDGEAIIINLATGVYYSLDQVGAAVWAMIEENCCIEEIVTGVVARYDVTKDRAQGDILRLIGELLREDIVATVDRPQTPTRTHAAPSKKAVYVVPTLHAYRDMEDLLALDPPTPSLSDIPWKA
jgi:hypothetical protein